MYLISFLKKEIVELFKFNGLGFIFFWMVYDVCDGMTFVGCKSNMGFVFSIYLVFFCSVFSCLNIRTLFINILDYFMLIF